MNQTGATMAMTKEDELLSSLLTKSDEMIFEEERAILEHLLETSPHLSIQLCKVYFEKSRRLKALIEELKKGDKELRNVIKNLSEPPWYPCDFLRYSLKHQKAIVKGDRKMVVSVHPDIEDEVKNLKAGVEVYLNNDRNCVIAVEEHSVRTGAVGIFERYHKGKGVLKGASDQEIVVDLSSECTVAELRPGDPVIFDPETRIAYERLEKLREEEYFFENPRTTFEEIGGLDEVIDELLAEIELHLFHRDIVRRHTLPMARGILLYGPPGCGKTLIARALANHIGKNSPNCGSRFMYVKPASHKSMWYGQSEANVRKIFRIAREAARDEGLPIIIFFDEIDNIGARSGDYVNTIDSRILPVFLSEIDGLEEAGDIFLIGATNRVDLLDDALMRPGRFGDRVFKIPRPNREAAAEIFRKYLTPDIPYLMNGQSLNDPADNSLRREEIIESIIESGVSHIYSPNGDGNLVATLIRRDGKKVPVYAPEVMSGALIANVVREAKKRSCLRGVWGMGEGIALEDILEAIDSEIETIAMRLKKVRGIHTILTDLPDDIDVVRVEVLPRVRNPASYGYLRGGG